MIGGLKRNGPYHHIYEKFIDFNKKCSEQLHKNVVAL